MNEITCSCCGNPRKIEDFYSSSSYFMKAKGKIHTCKKCLWEYVIPKDKVNYDLIKVKETLRSIDKPYIKDLWEASENESLSRDNKSDIFKLYMKNLGMRQYRDLTWEHSEFEKLTIVDAEEVDSEYVEDMNDKLTREDISYYSTFFGRGFSNEDYSWLSNEYQEFKNRYECDSKGMELLIKQIVLTELDIEKRRANNEKVDAQLKTLQDLLGSSNLKPVQETGANSVEHETFGTLIKKYENEYPIPEPDDAWKDVDSIGRYVRVFFTGHLARMLGKKDEKLEEEYWDEMKKFTVEEPEKEIDDGEVL